MKDALGQDVSIGQRVKMLVNDDYEEMDDLTGKTGIVRMFSSRTGEERARVDDDLEGGDDSDQWTWSRWCTRKEFIKCEDAPTPSQEAP